MDDYLLFWLVIYWVCMDDLMLQMPVTFIHCTWTWAILDWATLLKTTANILGDIDKL